jgi:phosphoribosylformylglycinamidine synthase
MKQKYPNEEVIARTVIISAGGNCTDIRKSEPVLQRDGGSIYYINLSHEYKLGGSSFAQTNTIGKDAPTIKDAAFFKRAFNTIQELILKTIFLLDMT